MKLLKHKFFSSIINDLQSYFILQEALYKLDNNPLAPIPHKNREWLLENYPNGNFALPSYAVLNGILPGLTSDYYFIVEGVEVDGKRFDSLLPKKDMFLYPKNGKKLLYRYIP